MRKKYEKDAQNGDFKDKLVLWMDRLEKNLWCRMVRELRDYCTVVLVCTLFVFFNEREQRRQEKQADVDLTFIDAAYFATVVATTVGYGHEIWPRTVSTKIFLIPYFLASTAVTALGVFKMAYIYLDSKKQKIQALTNKSLTYVYKADLHHRGTIFQSDFGKCRILLSTICRPTQIASTRLLLYVVASSALHAAANASGGRKHHESPLRSFPRTRHGRFAEYVSPSRQ